VTRAPQTGAVWWIPLGVGLLIALTALVVLARAARRERGGVVGVLHRVSGLPAWSAAAIAIALWSLLVALIGFVWDVAWHADIGRDKELFTPPHTMILVGLLGISAGAAAGIAVATMEDAPVGFRIGRLRVPWSTLPIGLMGAGAVVGFPLDDLWHRTYGIDVTMWSPTHLLMIGGAALTPLAVWLTMAEADAPVRSAPVVRVLSDVLAGAALLGLTAFQLEFDMGIPQWQALYHPVLVAMTMGIALVAAREVLGPGGAVRTVVNFLVLRGLLALLVGGLFDLSTPHFPIYVGGAVCVEAVYLFGPSWPPLRRVLVSGALIGTAGMAVEWWWTHIWGFQPWQTRLLPSWWVVLAMALVGAALGGALGRAVAHKPRLVEWRLVAVTLAALALLLAVPYPRHGTDLTARMSLTADGRVQLDEVSDPAGFRDADVFRALAWQGGDLVIGKMREVAPGRWEASEVLPSGGNWKNLLYFSKGPAVAAAPVQFPADPQYDLPAIAAPDAPRVVRLERATKFLTRESHSGNALPAVLAYTGLAVVATMWFVAVVGVGEELSRRVRAESSLAPAT
jgi:hypothetical protein